jgi:DNA-binding transcriptional regulator YiaG
MQTVTDHPLVLSTPQARATRCLVLRDMMGLSREAIRLRYGIARGTLQNWESARFGGLTEKGAKNILKAAQAEGIECDLQWLLHGIGPEPRLTASSDITDGSQLSKLIGSEQEMKNISTMLNAFRNHHPDAIDIVIQDTAMEPVFSMGEYIAGNRRYREAIESTVSLYCIVQTSEYGHLLRYVKLGDEIGLYHLFSLNPDTSVHQPTLYNIELISSAPVTWHHRLTPIDESLYL